MNESPGELSGVKRKGRDMMARIRIYLVVAGTIGVLACVVQGQGWDARQWNVPDTNKPRIEDPPGSGNTEIAPAYKMTCWQAVAANQLSAAGYEPIPFEIYMQIYNRFLNLPGVPDYATKWWLVHHGLNPDSFWYQADNPYTDLVIHNTPGLFKPEGPDGPQSDDWPADGAHAADYNELLDDLNSGHYVNIGMCQNLVGGGHALTLVGGNYANGPKPNNSVYRDPDTGPDSEWDGKANTFDPWQMLWTVYYADVLRPGLRKPAYAEANYDVASCWANAGILRDAGAHGDENGWDDYPEPEWLPGENKARIHGERTENRAGHVYLLVDYATAQAGAPQITVTDNDGNEAELVGPVRWSDSDSQALLHYRFIEYERDEQGRLMNVRPYQPEFQIIEFPGDDYRDMEHSVVGWDVATFCAPQACRTFHADSDPGAAPPFDEVWTELGGAPPVMANEMWFCHSNVYLSGLEKIVDFSLMYIRHKDDEPLYWDENDPGLYGAGYYEETFAPAFTDLSWSIEDAIFLDEEGNPDEDGDYIQETLHIYMTIGEHPDWEWIKLAGGWNPGAYETLYATFNTEWVPEPVTLVLMTGGLPLLLKRKRLRRAALSSQERKSR